MATNVTLEYQKAEQEYQNAKTNEEKLLILKRMLSYVPKHKDTAKLQKEIKERISKIKSYLEKEKKVKKSKPSLSIKKEGAAQVTIVGNVNSGKSTLLKKLTNANVEIASYPFTTKKPEVGIMDFKGIKIQVIEIPAVIKNFSSTENGPTFLSIIRQSDLIILLFNSPDEKKLLDKELQDINVRKIIYNNQENLPEIIWQNLDLIKIYTKQPGKEKDHPPIAMKKDSTVKDLAEKIHKDFLRKFRYARLYGKSVKFNGAMVGLDHKLQDEDVVEIHIK